MRGIEQKPAAESHYQALINTRVPSFGKETQGHDFFFSPAWLTREVERERQKPVALMETPWYHLAGTGFFVREEAAQLIRNTAGSINQVAPDVVERELSKVKLNMESFEDEYLKQMLTLRFNLAWEGEGEQRRVIAPDYANSPWESVTSKTEREGAVYETLFGNWETGEAGVEEWLKTAPANSFAVIVSPEGWSGLKDANGSNIRFPETQVYVIQTLPDGNLKARTLRYKADIMQNEELQRRLGLTIDNQPNQKERIKQMLKKPALIRGDQADRTITSFEDVVDLMQDVVGRKVAYEGKSFDEIRDFLKDPEKYSQRNPLTDKLIARFRGYARERLKSADSNLEKDIQIALAATVLQLNRMYREDPRDNILVGGHTKIPMSSESFIQKAVRMDYGAEKSDLQRRPGCAGGGKTTWVTSMGGLRKVEVTEGSIKSSGTGSEDYNFDHKGACVVCNKSPQLLGPCDICIDCDASMGGKGASVKD